MVPHIWQGWFLSVKNKNNFVGFHVKDELPDVDYSYFTTNKHHWKIYLHGYGEDGEEYMSSSLVEYDEKNGKVKTKSGSIYKLGKEFNDFQMKNLRNYFEKN